MYEIQIKGSSRAIQIGLPDKVKISAILGDDSVKNDTVLEINGEVFKKGDIRGIFKSENRHEGGNDAQQLSKLRNKINQTSNVIYLKEQTPETRTNLNPLKCLYRVIYGIDMSEEIETKIREAEKEFFIANPEKIIFFDGKLFDTLFGGATGKQSQASEIASKNYLENIFPSYLGEFREFEKKPIAYHRTVYKNSMQEFISKGGKANEVDIMTGKPRLKKYHQF